MEAMVNTVSAKEEAHNKIIGAYQQEISTLRAPYESLMEQNSMAGEDIRTYAYKNHDLVIELRERVRCLQTEIVKLNRKLVQQERSKKN